MKIKSTYMCTLLLATSALFSDEQGGCKEPHKLQSLTPLEKSDLPNSTAKEEENVKTELSAQTESAPLMVSLLKNHVLAQSALYLAFIQNHSSISKDTDLFNQLVTIAINTSDRNLYDMLLFSKHLKLINANPNTTPTTFDMLEESFSKGSLSLVALLVSQGAPTVTPNNESIVADFIDRYNIALANFLNRKNIASTSNGFENDKWQSDEKFSITHALKILNLLLHAHDVDFTKRYKDGKTILEHARTPEVIQLIMQHITAKTNLSTQTVSK